MSVLTEGRHTGEFLLSELPGTLSRDTATVVVPAATTLEPGTVLGQISGSGHYAPYDDRMSDGREEAAAILFDTLVNADDEPADMEAVVINAGAEVRADALGWEAGVDDDGGLVALAELLIKAR